ncbi:50S ribosomal protein L32 [Candidatus Roizmanbacteria bacterium]|nr:50S ribosomal protein L32 [Candidatus Roizmanbacteria bacterium]
MAPLPKRKHSTQRKGKRKKSRLMSLPKLVKCQNCGKLKIPHRICKFCGK